MKTFVHLMALTALCLAASSTAHAQANAANYGFTDTYGALTDMSSGTTQLIAADQDDTASLVTLIGFDFFFQGVRQDRFSVNSNGSFRFGSTAVSTTNYDPLAQAGQSLITAYGADQRTHAGDGKVHYKVVGTAPSRTLVVEWLNMQSDFNSGGAAGLTYQVRLTETTGAIEFVYGSMTMSAAGAADPNSSSPQFGFSANNTVGTVGSITAAQSGTPVPSFNGASATPVNNFYVAGAIPVFAPDSGGLRRLFRLTPAAVSSPGGPLTFTAVTTTSTTLNWTDSANEVGYAIYTSTDGTNFSFVTTAAQNATSFIATVLLESTSYSWRVYAVSEGATAFIGGTQATPTAIPNTSLGTGLWSSPGTWSAGTVPSVNDSVTIAAGTTVTIDTAAVAYAVSVANGGVLQFEQTSARTATVGTNVVVQSGGTLQSNPAGTQSGHNLSLAGNLTNNGTLDLSTNADTAGVIITFTGTTNAVFDGTGATTDIRQITVNKGTSSAFVMELKPTNFTVRGVTTDTVVGGWLVMTNGTLKISGTFSGSSRVFAAATYTIPANFGFWLNNPNYTVAAQNGNAVNNGLFRITQGTFNQGTTATSTFGGGVGAVFTIEGGAVSCAGRFNPVNAITYNQSAGSFNVATVGNNGSGTNNGSFGLTSSASTFNMTGGTIVLVQASTGATPIDYINNVTSVTAATGTLQAGTGATATNFNFRIRGQIPNLVIDNTTNNKTTTATAQINLLGTTTIQTGTILVINGQICLITGPSFINNGTLTGTAAGTRFYFYSITGSTTYSGPTTYSGSGEVTAPLTAFEVDNVFGATIDPAVSPIVANRFNNFKGGLTGSGKLTLGNGGATTAVVQLGVSGVTETVSGFDVAPVFNPGTGGVNLLYAPELTGRTTGNEVPPSRIVNQISVTNPNPITIAGGDLTVNGTGASAVALGSPRLITGDNTLHLNSTGGVTRTTGYVDGNFKKTFVAAGSLTYEVGTANGYSPVVVNATAGTFPADFAVKAVEATHPNVAPAISLKRYWSLTGTGITADLTFAYVDPLDVFGTEGSYQVGQIVNGAPVFAPTSTVNIAANTATVTEVTSFGDFTLGEPVISADLAVTCTDGVTTAMPGGSVTYTITVSNAGPSAVAGASVADTFPAALTVNWTASGAGGGTTVFPSGTGNIDTLVDLPPGGSVTFTAVASISGAASGSLSNTATIAAPAGVTDPNPANNSATDTDTLEISADLSITCTDGVMTAAPGGSVAYTIIVSNAGPSAITGATVADTFPAALTVNWTATGAGGGAAALTSGAGNINTTVDLPVGGSVTFTASATISGAASGSLSNTATIAAPGGTTDPNPANNSATDTDTLVPSANVAVTVTDSPDPVVAGTNLTYTITASNSGPSSAASVALSDTLPAGTTFVSLSSAGGWSATTPDVGSSGTIGASISSLAPGASAIFTLTVNVGSDVASGTVLSNTATISTATADPIPGDNSATATTTVAAQADLAITVTDGVTTAAPGGSVTYTITVSNAGPSNAVGVIVADTFPAALTVTWTGVGAGGGVGTASGAGNINDTLNLPAGGSFTYTASGTISAAATGTLTNTATVTAPAGVTDGNLGNNSATDVDTLQASPVVILPTTTNLTATTLTHGANVTSDGGLPITERGVVYALTSDNADPLIDGTNVTKITSPGTTGIFTVDLTGITASSAYSMKAYATNSLGTTYTAVTTTSTPSATAALARLVDTTQADFQAGTASNVNNTGAAGEVILAGGAVIDQENTTLGSVGEAMNLATWRAQTFVPGVTGSLTKAELNMFTAGMLGTPPNLTLSVRATSGGLPTGPDLATVTIPGFDNTFPGVFYSATFATPVTVTAGTTYALVIRPVTDAVTGLYVLLRSDADAYAGGALLRGDDSGTTWSDSAVDAGFKVYIDSGALQTSGEFTSSVKDSNPAPGAATVWTSIARTATTPAGTEIKFQVGASNAEAGPFTFVGPDGTAGTYYTSSDGSLSQFNGSRYLQYKAFFSTTDTALTPTLSDVTVTYGAYEPTVTAATTNEDVTSTSGLVITANALDGDETTHYKITSITNGALYQSDGTTVIASNDYITKAQGAAGLKFTPVANFSGSGSFNVQMATSSADVGLKGGVVPATITVNPVADTPSVTDSTTIQNIQSTTGLVISRHAVDGAEVGFYKISNIQHGTVFQNDGTTAIAAGSFITSAEGAAGLKFTPALNYGGLASFDVQAAVDGAGTGLSSGIATASILVGTLNPTPAQIAPANPALGYTVTGQTGLFDINVTITNTTPAAVNGFRLSVDFSAYLVPNADPDLYQPSLRLYNSSSAPGVSPAFVDYPFPVAQGASVTVKLSFYTSSRRMPKPFAPVLSVTSLPDSQTPGIAGPGVEATIRVNTAGVALLEWASTPGSWYLVQYSDDLTDWYTSTIPVQASSNRMQWSDSGAPFTRTPPGSSRFYLVREIPAPAPPPPPPPP